jgi:NADPH2:quinone reductase
MKAIEIREYGAPEVLQETQRPDPEPKAGEVLIRVAAAASTVPTCSSAPATIRCRPVRRICRGSRSRVWSLVATFASRQSLRPEAGDRVCALVQGGGYAELCTAPIEQCLPVPEGLTDIEAAALPETFFTVWSNVFDRGSRVRVARPKRC